MALMKLINERALRQFFGEKGALLAAVMRDMQILRNEITRDGNTITVRTHMCGVVLHEAQEAI